MREEKTPTPATLSREPFPASKKVYVSGTIYPNIKVAMREIELTDTVSKFAKIEKVEKNPSVTIYDGFFSTFSILANLLTVSVSSISRIATLMFG